MRILKMYDTSINQRFIDEAVKALENGEIVVYPTDSLYAMGCDASNNKAVEQLCRIKGIDTSKNHLAIICADLSHASQYVKIDNSNFTLLKRYLPGPYTFILPSMNKLPKAFKGRKEIGLRIPDDPVATALVERLGRPIMTTTLHLEEVDEEQMVTATADIAEQYGRSGEIAVMLDSGARGTTPTTVVNLSTEKPEIVRQGRGEFND